MYIKENERGSSLLIIILALALIVVIGAVGWMVYSNKDSTKTATTQTTDFTKPVNAADDIEITTDINAIHQNLEIYYRSKGYYPSEANLSDQSWVSANLTGLPEDNFVFRQSPRLGVEGSIYTYDATPADCTECTGYTLSVTQSTGAEYSKSNLN